MRYILFDVGANIGSDSINKTRNNKQIVTFAFEPTPYLYNKLKESTQDIADRYFISHCAVSNFVGDADFNIAGLNDWGCSSLNTFSENLNNTWPGRTDLKVTEVIKNIRVITIKYFIEKMCHLKIDKIDYFHCDTQGSDLNVLQGCGEYINIIQEGNIEVPDSESVKLYKENHSYEDAKNFLESNNFEIYDVTQQQNEKNLFFRRKQL